MSEGKSIKDQVELLAKETDALREKIMQTRSEAWTWGGIRRGTARRAFDQATYHLLLAIDQLQTAQENLPPE